MGIINRPNTYAPNTTIASSEINDDFDTIYSEFNGSITAANLATDSVTTAKIADSNVTSAKIADGNVTVGKMATTMGAGSAGTGAWDTWTPTFANFTKGSATIVAKYMQIGKTVHFRLNITLSSSTMGTSPTFTLPVTADTYSTQYPLAHGRIKDATGNGANAYAAWATSTTALIRYYNTSGADNAIDSTTPFTWANSDQISLNGTYEAA